jgi:hypothetical protein
MAVKNTLAYDNTAKLMAAKSFIAKAPGRTVNKLFSSVI